MYTCCFDQSSVEGVGVTLELSWTRITMCGLSCDRFRLSLELSSTRVTMFGLIVYISCDKFRLSCLHRSGLRCDKFRLHRNRLRVKFGSSCHKFGLSCDRFGLRCDRLRCDKFGGEFVQLYQDEVKVRIEIVTSLVQSLG